jgi:hypothetical protein
MEPQPLIGVGAHEGVESGSDGARGLAHERASAAAVGREHVEHLDDV